MLSPSFHCLVSFNNLSYFFLICPDGPLYVFSIITFVYYFNNVPGKCSREVFLRSVPRYVFFFGQYFPQPKNTSKITLSGITPCFSSHSCKSLGVISQSASLEKKEGKGKKKTHTILLVLISRNANRGYYQFQSL